MADIKYCQNCGNMTFVIVYVDMYAAYAIMCAKCYEVPRHS